MTNRIEDDMEEVLEVASPIWSPSGYAIFEDGTRISLKNTCLYCPYSLLYCQCHIVGRSPRAIHPSGGYKTVNIMGG